MSVHCTGANEQSPVQDYKQFSSAVQCMLLYAHIIPLNKVSKRAHLNEKLKKE